MPYSAAFKTMETLRYAPQTHEYYYYCPKYIFYSNLLPPPPFEIRFFLFGSKHLRISNGRGDWCERRLRRAPSTELTLPNPCEFRISKKRISNGGGGDYCSISVPESLIESVTAFSPPQTHTFLWLENLIVCLREPSGPNLSSVRGKS